MSNAKYRRSPQRDLLSYATRVCVAGSRFWDNPLIFNSIIRSYLEWLNVPEVAFISGGAASGADDLIIKWCFANNYDCYVFDADWDNLGKSAGFIRNAEMRKHLTHLLALWDGESKGTFEMIDNCMADSSLIVSVEMVVVNHYQHKSLHQKRKESYGRESKSR